MEAGSARIVDRTTDRTDIQRAREENYRALYTNIRFVAYLRTAIIVFVLYKKIRATWSNSEDVFTCNTSSLTWNFYSAPECVFAS